MGRSRYQNKPILNSKWINRDLLILISRSTHQKMDYISYWFTGNQYTNFYLTIYNKNSLATISSSFNFLCPPLYIFEFTKIVRMKIHDVISLQVPSWFVSMLEFCKGFVVPFYDSQSQLYLHLWDSFHKFFTNCHLYYLK